MQTEGETDLVDVGEAARRLSVSTSTVWRLAAEDGLPVVHVRGRVLFPVEGLREWVAAQLVKAATAKAKLETNGKVVPS